MSDQIIRQHTVRNVSDRQATEYTVGASYAHDIATWHLRLLHMVERVVPDATVTATGAGIRVSRPNTERTLPTADELNRALAELPKSSYVAADRGPAPFLYYVACDVPVTLTAQRLVEQVPGVERVSMPGGRLRDYYNDRVLLIFAPTLNAAQIPNLMRAALKYSG